MLPPGPLAGDGGPGGVEPLAGRAGGGHLDGDREGPVGVGRLDRGELGLAAAVGDVVGAASGGCCSVRGRGEPGEAGDGVGANDHEGVGGAHRRGDGVVRPAHDVLAPGDLAVGAVEHRDGGAVDDDERVVGLERGAVDRGRPQRGAVPSGVEDGERLALVVLHEHLAAVGAPLPADRVAGAQVGAVPQLLAGVDVVQRRADADPAVDHRRGPVPPEPAEPVLLEHDGAVRRR